MLSSSSFLISANPSLTKGSKPLTIMAMTPRALSYDEILKALPEEGLFRASASSEEASAGELRLPWLASPVPFVLSAQEARFLKSLGPILAHFYQVADDLYRASLKGKLSPWIAELLNAGKPASLCDMQRTPSLVGRLPQVIRPDLMLTDEGFALTELDSVPGGIGVTHWLSSLYADKGWEVVGGCDGMSEGFASMFRLPSGEKGSPSFSLDKRASHASLAPSSPSVPLVDIVIAQESEDYKPEMNYLARVLGASFRVRDAETYTFDRTLDSGVDSDHSPFIYRFFELFDLPNLPEWERMLYEHPDEIASRMTPPPKPHLEEKLLMALFHMPGLRALWKSRLRASHRERLMDIIPPTWVMDPTPLPPQASLPYLNLHSWDEVASLSQKERRLVAKISGFHPQAWGSRGVHIGHDLSTEEWTSVVENALADYADHPWILQQFAPGRIVQHPYYDPETKEEKIMEGRVRLCPYYFRSPEGNVVWGGCLATIAPADKKKIHGMRDAVLVPCVVGG